MAIQFRSFTILTWLAAGAGLAVAQTAPAGSGSARSDAMTACAGIVNASVRQDCMRRQALMPDSTPGALSPPVPGESPAPGGMPTPGAATSPGSTGMSPGATGPGTPATLPNAVQGGSALPPPGVR